MAAPMPWDAKMIRTVQLNGGHIEWKFIRLIGMLAKHELTNKCTNCFLVI
jgi:hypothetical protein